MSKKLQKFKHRDQESASELSLGHTWSQGKNMVLIISLFLKKLLSALLHTGDKTSTNWSWHSSPHRTCSHVAKYHLHGTGRHIMENSTVMTQDLGSISYSCLFSQRFTTRSTLIFWLIQLPQTHYFLLANSEALKAVACC